MGRFTTIRLPDLKLRPDPVATARGSDTPASKMNADLSLYHAPVTDLFSWRSSDNWNQYQLTDDQIDFFHNHGYLSGIRALNCEQVDALRAELAELTDPNHP